MYFGIFIKIFSEDVMNLTLICVYVFSILNNVLQYIFSSTYRFWDISSFWMFLWFSRHKNNFFDRIWVKLLLNRPQFPSVPFQLLNSFYNSLVDEKNLYVTKINLLGISYIKYWWKNFHTTCWSRYFLSNYCRCLILSKRVFSPFVTPFFETQVKINIFLQIFIFEG